VQLGVQTCTRILAFREFRSIYALVNREWLSLLQVAVWESRNMPLNSIKLAYF